MDREEAIKVLTLALMQCGMMMPIEWVKANGKDSEFDEAFLMAIAALREQEQREQGCEFCNESKDLYFHEGACNQMNDSVYVSGNRIECDFGCKAWGAFDIKFCPKCGRKLKEGAN